MRQWEQTRAMYPPRTLGPKTNDMPPNLMVHYGNGGPVSVHFTESEKTRLKQHRMGGNGWNYVYNN